MGRTKGIIALMLAGLFSLGTGRRDAEVVPLRIGVVRFVHQHVEGLLWNARERKEIEIVGVYEPDRALFDRLAAKYGLDPALRFDDLGAMLDSAKPEAVSVMSAIADHASVAAACAPRGVHMLFEKPLAYTTADAHQIADLAARHNVLALTNFETSWYASLREAKRLVSSGDMAPIRKMVFRHGHKGPIEIGCTREFTDWLTDPAQNGGGAIVDFGCYGAVLATWLMDGQRPTSVSASASTLKPDVYPRVDDDATILLAYPGATATIQASWAWTHDNKEADLYTERGSIHAGRWDELSVRAPDKAPREVRPPQKPDHLRDDSRDPAATRDILEAELAEHSDVFATRPRVYALNKADITENRDRFEEVAPNFDDPFLISGVTGEGVPQVLERLWELVEQVRLEEAGVIEAPVLEIRHEASELVTDERAGSRWDWIVFSSQNGVDAFFAALRSAGCDARSLGTTKVAAVGPATSAAAERHGIVSDFVPSVATGEAMAAELPRVHGARVLLPFEGR